MGRKPRWKKALEFANAECPHRDLCWQKNRTDGFGNKLFPKREPRPMLCGYEQVGDLHNCNSLQQIRSENNES